MGKRDPRVDAYIERAAEFAQPILRYLREVIHSASPAVEETMKWSFPHFTQDGILCSMAAFKQHCAFGFWRGDLVLGEAGEAGTQAMGQFGPIASLADLPPREVLVGYVREAIRLNETGIARKKPPAPKREPEPPMPEAFRIALEQDSAAKTAFEGLSPSCRREYIEWIADAKRDETRERRIRTALEWIAEGKSRNWKYQKC